MFDEIDPNESKISYKELVKLYNQQIKRLNKILKLSDKQEKYIIELKDKFEQMAYIDPLTNIYNRRYFFELAQKHITQAKKRKYPFNYGNDRYR